MSKFTLTGTHPEDLADGRIVAVGGQVDLSKEQIDEPHNARLIEEGKLVAADSPSKKSGKMPPPDGEGNKEGDGD